VTSNIYLHSRWIAQEMSDFHQTLLPGRNNFRISPFVAMLVFAILFDFF